MRVWNLARTRSIRGTPARGLTTLYHAPSCKPYSDIVIEEHPMPIEMQAPKMRFPMNGYMAVGALIAESPRPHSAAQKPYK